MPADMIVIPVDSTRPVRVVTDAEEPLAVLRREIGRHRVDHSAFPTPWGPVQLWLADDSLLGDSIDHNQRAIALCRHCGFDVPDVGGVAVATSYNPTTGEAVNPPAELLEYLEGWSPGDGELARAAEMRLATPGEVDAFMQRLLQDR